MSTASEDPARDSVLASMLPADLATALRSKLNSGAIPQAPRSAASAEEKPRVACPPPPPEPQTLAEAGLGEGLATALVLKALLRAVNATGADLAREVCLSRSIVNGLLARLREDLLITIKGQAGTEYVYQLTEAGHTCAMQHAEQAAYASAAPVPLEAYSRAVAAQGLGQAGVTLSGLRAAFAGLTVSDDLLSHVAQAVFDCQALFLYGAPGNGKTTIAERLCGAFGKFLWTPRAVAAGSDFLRVFDESCHVPAGEASLEGVKYDRRWVLIERPTVVVGGELTLDQLDPAFNPASGVSEAPVQMKANGGVLVIDDFGRQRVSSTELLNRLIVPLEKRFDYLSLASGRQARIPFELLCVLSTNLEPRELVDEAFLRRVPYKIQAPDPTVAQFHELFVNYAKQIDVELVPGAVEWLLTEHYQPSGRPMRFCHPRDLLRQARNYCSVHGLPMRIEPKSLEAAVGNYFAGI